MPVELLHHTSESMSGGLSPFDKAITRITQEKDISIACPYLGMDYLKQIIKGCNSWRILTDVEEWIISQAENARLEIEDFIASYSERIHHYPDLHAKVIIAENSALVGSANFTEKGITQRSEMCVLFESTNQVTELQRWFDWLWQMSAPVDRDELSIFVRAAPSAPGNYITRIKFSSPAPEVNAKRVIARKRNPVSIQESREAHDRLVDRIKLAPGRKWISEYFNLINEIIDFAEITSDDPRLVLTIPAKSPKLPVNINQRYVLNAGFVGEEAILGFILSADFVRYRRLKNEVERYRPQRGEFKDEVPYWVRYYGTPNRVLSGDLKGDWKMAVLAELQRQKRSGFRKFHEPLVYEAAVNTNYRALILDEAFSSKPSH